MSIKGFKVNGEIHRYDYESLENKPSQSGSGLTDEIKQALLACFENVAWINADGHTYYDALAEALNGSGTVYYSVTNSLTDCTTSNGASRVAEGDRYTAKLSTASDYVLTSVKITMGGNDVTNVSYSGGTISIPNVTGDIVITAVATQRVANLTSISAVFTQGGNTIYATDSLDSLKQYLVVTATYDDSSTATVASNDYTLSGTLTEGTSTITVSYGGKTTTFNVTVSHYVPALIHQTSNQALDGSTTIQIDTGVVLLKENAWTIATKYKFNTTASKNYMRVFEAGNATSIGYFNGSGTGMKLWYKQTQDEWSDSIYDFSSTSDQYVVFTHVAGSSQVTIHYIENSAVATVVHQTAGNFDGDTSVIIGNRSNGNTNNAYYFKGTIIDFSIYNGVVDSAFISDYLGV